MTVSKERIEKIRLSAGTVGMVFDHHNGKYRFGKPNDGETGYFGMKPKRTLHSLKKAEAYADGLRDG